MIKVTRNKPRKSRRTIVITIVSLLLLGGVATFLLRDTLFPAQNTTSPVDESSTTSTDLNPPTDDQQSAGDKAKEDFINKTEDNTSSGTASVSISSTATNENTFSIRTIITTVDESGTCTLSMTSSGKETISQSVGTQSLGSYSVCKGFDVDKNLMGSASWKAKIVYKGSGGQATVEKDVKV